MNLIRTEGSRFIDTHGRHIILHGISMICKDKERNYIGDWTTHDFMKLKEWGFNVIRLGIIWDGVEPEPGRYDDTYLSYIRKWIQFAHLHQLYVILDMHQDLYSSLYSDGAPAWATFSGGHTYEKTDLWSDAYLFDRAVQCSFDHFWSNTPAPDGIGIQDHYLAAWKYVAQQLRDEPNLIGYDLMNEPFIGSDVQGIVTTMFSAYADLVSDYTGEEPPSMDELIHIWIDPVEKRQALNILSSVESYRSMMEATATAQADFERNILSPFYQKASESMRETDSSKILFLETNYFSNLGVSSSLQPILNKFGRRDKQQAYAPHGYDIVTDSDDVHAANNDRVSYIFEQHESTKKRLEMPMLIGEWGAYGESLQAEEASLHIQKIFEELLCSDIYWCYLYPEMDRYSSFKGVCRGYPMAVSGTIINYSYEHSTSTFLMEWDEDINVKAPTLIYLPKRARWSHTEIALTPHGSPYEWIEPNLTDPGFCSIDPVGGGRRTLRIGERP